MAFTSAVGPAADMADSSPFLPARIGSAWRRDPGVPRERATPQVAWAPRLTHDPPPNHGLRVTYAPVARTAGSLTRARLRPKPFGDRALTARAATDRIHLELALRC